MKLGVFLPIGSSFKDQKKSGQDKRFVRYYLEKYVEKFEKVFVFTYENEKYKLPKNCVLVPNVFSLNRFFYSFLTPFLNWKIIKEINIFRVTQLTGVVPAILINIFLKKPFIFTYGYDYHAITKLENQRIRAILLKILERIAVKFSSGVVTPNKKIESYLRKKYPKVKLFYIPNGVDISKFKAKRSAMKPQHQSVRGRQFSTESPKHSRKNETMNILFVGRLVKQKNLDSFIKAIALLKSKDKIFLLFIGCGNLKLRLIKLAKNEKVKLKIIDKIEHNKIVKYYQQADIFCLPSYLEGQPKTLLEAMACSLPCLVGNYSGVEEFEDRKEVLVTGFKAGEIAKNLDDLIKDYKLRKNLSQNARKRAERDFDINKLMNKEILHLRKISKRHEI